jgi:hypothetical protein
MLVHRGFDQKPAVRHWEWPAYRGSGSGGRNSGPSDAGAAGVGVGVVVGVGGGVFVSEGPDDDSVGVVLRGIGGRSAPTLTTPSWPGTQRTPIRIRTAAKTAKRRMSTG